MANNTKTTLNQHYVIEAYKDFLKGVLPSEIKRKLTDGVYGPKKYTDAQAKHLMEAIRKKIHEDFEEDKPLIKDKLYATLNNLLQNSVDSNDRKNSLKIVENLMKLTGASEPERQEIDINGTIDIDFGFDDDDDNSDEEE